MRQPDELKKWNWHLGLRAYQAGKAKVRFRVWGFSVRVRYSPPVSEKAGIKSARQGSTFTWHAVAWRDGGTTLLQITDIEYRHRAVRGLFALVVVAASQAPDHMCTTVLSAPGSVHLSGCAVLPMLIALAASLGGS